MNITDFSLDLFRLDGRVAVVTGGNTGLGQAFSLALASAGADVFAVGMDDDAGATEQLVTARGSRYEFRRTDLTADGACAETVEQCVETFGHLDVLLNCAGICHIAPLAEFGRQRWDPMLALNLTAAFELSQLAASHMVAHGAGKIINIASLFSFLGGQGSPAYAASKHGILGLTRAYCDELATHNVQVNAIAPGYFATEITAATRSDPQAAETVLRHIPAGRWGDAADLMGAAVFLASRASDYVNGQVLSVDGGYLTR